MKQPKMKWGRAILISLPFFAVTMFWQVYDYIVPLMLTKHYSLSTYAYSAIMAIDNVVALVFLPLFGALSDRINGRMGRRSPLILLGTVGGLIGFFVLNYADAQAVAGGNTFFLFMIGLLVAVFFMSLYRSPSAALVADCFIRPQRTKANAVLNLMGALAGVIFSILGRRLIFSIDGVPVFTKCVYFAILVMIIATGIYFLFMRENKFVKQVQEMNSKLGLVDNKTDASNKERTKLSAEEKKSLVFILGAVFMVYMAYNGFNTHYTNYLVTYLQKDASWTTPYLLRVLLCMINMIPAAMIASKIGRRKSCIIGCVLCIAGYLGMFSATPDTANVLYIWGIVFSLGFPMLSINLGPMVLELGKDCDSGRYMGYYYVATTVAQIITPMCASVLITAISYKVIGAYAAFFVLLTMICCIMVRHGDAKPIVSDAVDSAMASDD